MYKLNLYVFVEPAVLKESQKVWYYCLEYGVHRLYGSGSGVMTFNRATLTAICAGLARLTQNSEVIIHSENMWAMNAMTSTLTEFSALRKWAENDFRKPNGERISNEQEWRTIWAQTGSHKLVPEPIGKEHHTWLSEIAREHQIGAG